jgi:hypothetical protein
MPRSCARWTTWTISPPRSVDTFHNRPSGRAWPPTEVPTRVGIGHTCCGQWWHSVDARRRSRRVPMTRVRRLTVRSGPRALTFEDEQRVTSRPGLGDRAPHVASSMSRAPRARLLTTPPGVVAGTQVRGEHPLSSHRTRGRSDAYPDKAAAASPLRMPTSVLPDAQVGPPKARPPGRSSAASSDRSPASSTAPSPPP